MAIEMLGISAGLNIASGIFGGGGPRAPRMNPAQQQLMQSQANLNNALANRINCGAFSNVPTQSVYTTTGGIG